MAETRAREDAPRWRRALSFVRGHRGQIALILALTLLVGGLGAVEPLLFKVLFDGLGAGLQGEHQGVQGLLTGVLALVGIGVLREVVGGLSNWLTWRTRIRLHYRLLEATVTRLHALPVSFHARSRVGDVMTRVERGIQGLVGAFSEIAFNVVPAVVYLATAMVIMLQLSPTLALVVLVFAPLPALVGALAAREQTERDRDLLGRWSSIYGRLNEVLHGIVTVKSFAMEDRETQRFLSDVDRANGVVVRGVGRDSLTGGLRNLVVVLASATAVGVGGWLVLRGQTTVGTVVAFMGYVQGLFGPVQGLTGIYQTFRRASVALDTVLEILDHPVHPDDAPHARDVGPVRGEVVFEDVSFSYDGHRPVLDGFDLRVSPGQVVALVGPSGSGKSTLMALLKRLHDPTAGRVLVDGQDLRDLKQRALRRQIGVVLQEPVLFDDTVRANIAYGRPDADQADIEAAARAAQAHDFICALPDGYDSRVGEQGKLLSVGQRQRISIARALLKDPAILILDEPTAALDPDAEAAVQAALSTLVKGRTTFVIAHRLSTVVDADRIVVLRDGRVVEEGRHRELMSARGTYARMVERQVGGLIPATA